MDFDRLATRHRDAVYRQMVRVCGNHDDAEDALAQALIAAYRHSRQLRDETAFPQWLTTIGRRVCGHMRRHESLHEVVTGLDLDRAPDPGRDIEGELDKQQMAVCVHEAVDELPQSLRCVYDMCDLQGNSPTEAAEKLGLTVAATKSRLHRARAAVRESLDKSVCLRSWG